MNELRIILARPVTFTCRLVAGMVMVVAPSLDSMKDKALSDVSAMTWLILTVALLGAGANTIAAWFSSSAGTAKTELAAAEQKLNEKH